jgi:hypothetical protein
MIALTSAANPMASGEPSGLSAMSRARGAISYSSVVVTVIAYFVVFAEAVEPEDARVAAQIPKGRRLLIDLSWSSPLQ